MFVLDTNVLSELRRPDRTHPRVALWADSVQPEDLYLSVITLLEIETGALLVGRHDKAQGAVLRSWIDRQVLPNFATRILPVDAAVARRCAALHVPNPRPERDALIAATALVHRLRVVTRNVADFAPMQVDVLNPLGLNTAAGWRGQLALHYTRVGGRTTSQDRHQGPLRVLKPLYPEGPGICHHVIVHPPGGVVAGDELLTDVRVGAGAHALVTTPGATRFYRSEGATALQEARLRLDANARLEWLPMEAIAYSGCRADNRVSIELGPGAEAIGWDLLALGLPAANQPFVKGWYRQHLEIPGVWLERGKVAADDAALLASPVGWGGQRVLATMWFAAGSALVTARREALLQVARDAVGAHALAATAGVTSPQTVVLVLRVLAPQVEAAMSLLAQVRAAWRQAAWGLRVEPLRIWRT